MNILFVIRTMLMGGAGKQLALTAKALADGGHEVGIYTYMGFTLEHPLDPRIKYYPEEHIPLNKFEEHVLSIAHLRKLIKELNIDLVIGWRSNSGFIARLATIGLKTRCIYSERTDPYVESKGLLKLATFVSDFSDGGVFQTVEARDFYKRLAHKSVIIPNIIDITSSSDGIVPIDNRRKEIAWVGRFFNQQKRIDIALQAMKLIHESLPDYSLSIYGDGVDKNLVEKWVDDYQLMDCVVLHGAKKDIQNIIKYSRVLMISSDYEGIPNVIIEAFLAGTPVVSTDCSPGGARLLIEDGVNGFIVPTEDSKALAYKCKCVIADDLLSLKFINNSKKKLQDFMPDKICQKWNEYVKHFSPKKSH